MVRPFDFSKEAKDQAFVRQWNRCAHCGQSLVDVLDHAHHVVPNQIGKAGDPRDSWMRSQDNCVVLCEDCHVRVHEDGRFRAGAVASPDYFPYSHGKQKAAHDQWAEELRQRFWAPR
jgi:hypothetical protein